MNELQYKIHSFTEQSIYISFGQGISQSYLTIIRSLMNALANHQPTGFIEAVPGYNNITIYYDAIQLYQKYQTVYVQEKFIHEVHSWIKNIQINEASEPAIIRLPVCYDERFGHDLAFVSQHNQLTIDDIIKIHSEAQYTVHMLGFSPGFPFLSGLSQKLETPRKTTPSQAIPAGSVGIAGKQTGIYPVETPGGWQIIGRTPLPLFDLKNESPSLLNAGDMVQFYPITIDEFKELEVIHHDYNS